jgi:hypothetical protein
MARLFSRANRLDSSLYYDRESYEIAAKASDRKNMLEAATVLASFFEKKNNDSTLKYLKITIALKDSLFNQEKTKQVQSLTINEQLRQQEIESAKKAAAEERHQNIQYALIGIGIHLLYYSFFTA